jgi:hypothetical protein
MSSRTTACKCRTVRLVARAAAARSSGDVTGDVSDGVERHDLMEVDLVDLDTVDAGFGSRQRLEDS